MEHWLGLCEFSFLDLKQRHSHGAILPWTAERPQQEEKCEPICRAEAFPVGGREVEQVMAALTQRECDIFQQVANLQL